MNFKIKEVGFYLQKNKNRIIDFVMKEVVLSALFSLCWWAVVYVFFSEEIKAKLLIGGVLLFSFFLELFWEKAVYIILKTITYVLGISIRDVTK